MKLRRNTHGVIGYGELLTSESLSVWTNFHSPPFYETWV